jgi:hypothetical protein
MYLNSNAQLSDCRTAPATFRTPDGRTVPRYQPERLRDQLRRVGYDSIILTAHAPAGRDNQGAWTFPLQTKVKGP